VACSTVSRAVGVKFRGGIQPNEWSTERNAARPQQGNHSNRKHSGTRRQPGAVDASELFRQGGSTWTTRRGILSVPMLARLPPVSQEAREGSSPCAPTTVAGTPWSPANSSFGESRRRRRTPSATCGTSASPAPVRGHPDRPGDGPHGRRDPPLAAPTGRLGTAGVLPGPHRHPLHLPRRDRVQPGHEGAAAGHRGRPAHADVRKGRSLTSVLAVCNMAHWVVAIWWVAMLY